MRNSVSGIHIEAAHVRLQLTQEHGEKRRFTTAIGPHQAEPVAGMRLERHVFKQQFAPAAQTHLLKTQHGIQIQGGNWWSDIISFLQMKKVLYLSLLVLAFLAWRDWTHREIVHEPGVLVTELPRQRNLQDGDPIVLDEYRLKRRAEFDIRARVLSREDYRWGTESDLSPIDLALGWGAMSDQAVLDRMTISQGSRWYYFRYKLPAPIPKQAMINNSGNMHMVPSNKWVLKKLKEIRRGDVVRLKGFLVDVDSDAGFTWRTSLRRDDTGGGSCEIVYVSDIYIEERG